MELWDWDDVRDNRWTRLSKCVQLLGIRIKGHDTDEHDEERVSWAEATRNIRRLRNKLHDMQWSKDQWSAEVWNDKGPGEATQMTQKQWKLLWEGRRCFGSTTRRWGERGSMCKRHRRSRILIIKRHHAYLLCCVIGRTTRLASNCSAYFYRSTSRM